MEIAHYPDIPLVVFQCSHLGVFRWPDIAAPVNSRNYGVPSTKPGASVYYLPCLLCCRVPAMEYLPTQEGAKTLKLGGLSCVFSVNIVHRCTHTAKGTLHNAACSPSALIAALEVVAAPGLPGIQLVFGRDAGM